MSQEQTIGFVIPDGVFFEQLKLSRDSSTGDVSFDWSPIEAICDASGINISMFRDQDEDNVGALIVSWYNAHVAAGGARDQVAEQLIAEVEAEAVAGMAGVQPGGGRVH